MLRLSSFWRWVIWYLGCAIVITITSIINMGDDFFYKAMLLTVEGIIVFFSLFVLTEDLQDIVSFRYKIVEESSCMFYAYTLRPWWFIIPYWKSIKTKSGSYKAQNIFGAKHREYYEYDSFYSTMEKAQKAINKHEEELREARREFFRRPGKEEIKKTTYI